MLDPLMYTIHPPMYGKNRGSHKIKVNLIKTYYITHFISKYAISKLLS